MYKVLTFIIFVAVVIGGTANHVVGVELEAPYEQSTAYINPARPVKASVSPGTVDELRSKLGPLQATWIDVKFSEAGTYDWHACELPLRAYWQDYADFVQIIIDEFQPEYIGIWSKPEYNWYQYDDYFGCVADGVMYGEFAAFIADHVSGAQVIAGNVEDVQSSFFASMVSLTAGHVDGYAIHCYGSYVNGLINDCQQKLDYAQSLVSVPVYLSETGVINKDNYDGGYDAARADFFDWLETLDGPVFWYTLSDDSGWIGRVDAPLCPGLACELYRE